MTILSDYSGDDAQEDARSGTSQSDDLDGAAVLDEVRELLRRFVSFPTQAALIAVTLWTAHSHLIQTGDNTPRLALLSPEPGSGKTRTLEVLDLLVRAPLFTFSATPASIFRSLKKRQRTILFDEADTIFRRGVKTDGSEDLRALLNAGHRRGAKIPRCIGPTYEVEEFPVFAAVVLSGLGDLPETLMSRSIVIRMRRRLESEKVDEFRSAEVAPVGADLQERLARWCELAEDRVGESRPKLPPGVADRQADVWEPLIAIADVAGGHWPEAARRACLELVRASASQGASLRLKLLEDIRGVWRDAEATLTTKELLRRLVELEESPWANLRNRELDARGLADRLRPLGVTSRKIKFGEMSLRGYRRSDFVEAFERYLPPETPESPEPTEPVEPDERKSLAGVPEVPEVPAHGGSLLAPASSSHVARCEGWCDSPPCEFGCSPF
jgi:Protein of unknown function (DUF3631)